MDMATQERAGLRAHLVRTEEEVEHLRSLQEWRAARRPKDAYLASAVLEAVEIVAGAATALESAGWSKGPVAMLSAVTNLLLRMDLDRIAAQTEWSAVYLPPLVAKESPRSLARLLCRGVSRRMTDPEFKAAYAAAAEALRMED